MSFRWSIPVFCSLVLFHAGRTSSGSLRQFPASRINPGFPIPIKTNDPDVQKAARDGVYAYNNSSNNIFLFKESRINKAMVQIVRGLKYNLDVDIARTVCTKREHLSLDQCHFQEDKKLRQTFRCYFEVWLVPWLRKVEVLVSHCQ